MGYVHHARHSGRYGFAAMVGACGYDSDWHCELVVCISDGLVWVGRPRNPKKDAGLKPGATKATSQTTSKPTACPICDWKPGENRPHGGGMCVILRLRLIQRLWLCGPSEWLS